MMKDISVEEVALRAELWKKKGVSRAVANAMIDEGVPLTTLMTTILVLRFVKKTSSRTGTCTGPPLSRGQTTPTLSE